MKMKMILSSVFLSVVACKPMLQDDPADLTPIARSMERLATDGGMWTTRDVPGLGGPPLPGVFEAPETLRMWLRSEGSSESCSGTVIEVELEDYIRHVIPHEWYASWHEESLRAGAVAARSYATWWVIAGGKYDCADVCDTSYTQNYGETTDSRTDAAILSTASTFIMDDGDVVFAEYSAENGDPTEYGVVEPHCTGEDRYGHGRGLCQWGSQRWATNEGKDHAWMADHYYLGATLLGPLEGARLDDAAEITMESGEVLTIELMWENLGSTRWLDGGMHLETTDPEGRVSEFSAGWVDVDRASTLSGDVAPGDLAIMELVLTAPEVSEQTSFVEPLGLYSADLDAWVSTDIGVELNIEVYPVGSAPETHSDEDESDRDDPDALPDRTEQDSELKAGCSCGGGLAGSVLGFPLVLWGLGRRRA
jgi:hypothetical protein